MGKVFYSDTYMAALGEDLMGKAVTKETTLRVQEPWTHAKQNPW